jgi:hypothetical protein
MPLRREHLSVVVKALVTYGLDISVRGNGTTDPAPGSYTYTEGTTVTVTAIPVAGSAFDHWELDGVFAGTSITTNVTMTTYHALVAVFATATYSVTVRAGEGGTTNPVPGTYGPYSYGYLLTVTAVPSSGYKFESWLVDGTTYYDNPLVVTVTKALTLTATFSTIPKSTLSGVVSNVETNVPIMGASVTLDSASSSSGSDGKYSLTVNAGVYKLTVKAGGYQDYAETVDLSKGGTFLKDVKLSKTPQSIIQGVVMNNAGNPVVQATVTANGYSAATDANGNFTLTVAPREYVVSVAKAGWRVESKSIDASTAGTYSLNFTLTPSQSTIQGVVTDEANLPIAEVTIAADAYSTTSDANGNFTLTLPPASYTLIAKKEGYKDWSQTVDATTPATYVINITLIKKTTSFTVDPKLILLGGIVATALVILMVKPKMGGV